MEFLLNLIKQRWEKFIVKYPRTAFFFSTITLVIIALSIIVPLLLAISQLYPSNDSIVTPLPSEEHPIIHENIIIEGSNNQVQKTKDGNIYNIDIKTKSVTEQ